MMRNLAKISPSCTGAQEPERHSASGYTAIELLMALAVLALLCGLAMPAMGNLLMRHRLAAISNEFLLMMNMARHEAMHRRMRVTLCRTENSNAVMPRCAGPGATWSEGMMAFIDTAAHNPPQPDHVSAILRVRGAIDPGYAIARKGLSSASFSFAASGRLKSGTLGVSFRIAPKGDLPEERWLCVASTGRIRVTQQTCD